MRGSRKRFSIGTPFSMARAMISAAMPQRSSASAGILPLPRVSAMILALYLPASSIIGKRSGSLDVELMIGTPHALLCALSPASMALMFVVSRQSGFSTASCRTFTAQPMSLGPFSSAGPMEMSIKCAPALACATASSWSGLGSNFVRAAVPTHAAAPRGPAVQCV